MQLIRQLSNDRIQGTFIVVPMSNNKPVLMVKISKSRLGSLCTYFWRYGSTMFSNRLDSSLDHKLQKPKKYLELFPLDTASIKGCIEGSSWSIGPSWRVTTVAANSSGILLLTPEFELVMSRISSNDSMIFFQFLILDPFLAPVTRQSKCMLKSTDDGSACSAYLPICSVILSNIGEKVSALVL